MRAIRSCRKGSSKKDPPNDYDIFNRQVVLAKLDENPERFASGHEINICISGSPQAQAQAQVRATCISKKSHLQDGIRDEEEGTAEIKPPYTYWLQKVNESPPKQYPWAIIDEDVFDKVETHRTKAQSELIGFIKEACKWQAQSFTATPTPKLVVHENVLPKTVDFRTQYTDYRDAFLTLTTPTLVEGETCDIGPDDFAVEDFTTGAHDSFEARYLEPIEKVNSARSILNG
ncbi:hypothetical protein EAF00_002903 [Botryotinia globosa]|nr:hypothetical protein EAF00_002903 [Botryotinia globosa]